MADRRVTINDVAAAAGVSRQTVTRAMNGMPEITAATRDRVLRVGEELGYRPSRFAANLARQKHHSVGLMLRTLRNPYYADLAADFLVEAGAQGWQTTLATTDGADESDVLAALVGHVDVLVGYFGGQEEDIVRAARGVPAILIERPATLPGLHSIALDFERGMLGLVEGLLAKGVRRIAMIDSTPPDREYSPSRRRAGFEHAIAELGVDGFCATALESPEHAGAAFAELVEAGREIDAVIAFNDLMAMGVMQRARDLGLRVPDDVRVVGIDGLSLGTLMSPQLSTLSIDRESLSSVAGGLIADAIAGALAAPETRTVVPRPVWRASA